MTMMPSMGEETVVVEEMMEPPESRTERRKRSSTAQPFNEVIFRNSSWYQLLVRFSIHTRRFFLMLDKWAVAKHIEIHWNGIIVESWWWKLFEASLVQKQSMEIKRSLWCSYMDASLEVHFKFVVSCSVDWDQITFVGSFRFGIL